MKRILTFTTILILLAACSAFSTLEPVQSQPTLAPAPTGTRQEGLPNPASAFCVGRGYRVDIRTTAGGSQSGYCIFPDGSECEEWAYFRGECSPSILVVSPAAQRALPTAMPIDPADYQQGWWTYKHPVYGFSIMLPEDWVVEEITTFDPLMNGHSLSLHPNYDDEQNIHMAFSRVGEDVRLWPTGVGQGEFIEQGNLNIAGQASRRCLLVCPNGDVTAIWYHGSEEAQPNIVRGDMEFGYIYSAGGHCEPGLSLGGKTQRWGEMIIASLKVP
jgi:putative hemolysin